MSHWGRTVFEYLLYDRFSLCAPESKAMAIPNNAGQISSAQIHHRHTYSFQSSRVQIASTTNLLPQSPRPRRPRSLLLHLQRISSMPPCRLLTALLARSRTLILGKTVHASSWKRAVVQYVCAAFCVSGYGSAAESNEAFALVLRPDAAAAVFLGVLVAHFCCWR